MMYLSLDTIKCASNANYSSLVYEQCSGVLLPQQSICIFLLFLMTIKIMIASL